MKGPANKSGRRTLSVVVMGGSAGGIAATQAILSALPPLFSLPVAVVLHQSADAPQFWQQALQKNCSLKVVEAEDKMAMEPGTIYCGPANYHLLIETDGRLALSVDEKVNYARPSIDLLFSSAADAFHEGSVGIVLTGANGDGAQGLADIAARGGVAIVQSPATAEWAIMPESALNLTPGARVLDLKSIAPELAALVAAGFEGNSTG